MSEASRKQTGNDIHIASKNNFEVGGYGFRATAPSWLVVVGIIAVLAVLLYGPTRNAVVCVITSAKANCERNQGDIPKPSVEEPNPDNHNARVDPNQPQDPKLPQ